MKGVESTSACCPKLKTVHPLESKAESKGAMQSSSGLSRLSAPRLRKPMRAAHRAITGLLFRFSVTKMPSFLWLAQPSTALHAPTSLRPTEARSHSTSCRYSGVDRYRSADDAKRTTMVFPANSGRRATCKAAAQVAPEEIPAGMPSNRAS